MALINFHESSWMQPNLSESASKDSRLVCGKDRATGRSQKVVFGGLVGPMVGLPKSCTGTDHGLLVDRVTQGHHGQRQGFAAGVGLTNVVHCPSGHVPPYSDILCSSGVSIWEVA